MLHWSLALGLAPALVDALARLVDDEREHAALSAGCLEAAGGSPDHATIPQAALRFTLCPDEPLERRALAAALQEFALHESIAFDLFRALEQTTLVPVVRRALRRITRDEDRHRRTGWALLEALLERTGERAWLQALLPTALAGVLAGYATSSDPPTTAEARWGLLPPEVVHRSIARTRRAYVGRHLRRLGLVA